MHQIATHALLAFHLSELYFVETLDEYESEYDRKVSEKSESIGIASELHRKTSENFGKHSNETINTNVFLKSRTMYLMTRKPVPPSFSHHTFRIMIIIEVAYSRKASESIGIQSENIGIPSIRSESVGIRSEYCHSDVIPMLFRYHSDFTSAHAYSSHFVLISYLNLEPSQVMKIL